MKAPSSPMVAGSPFSRGPEAIPSVGSSPLIGAPPRPLSSSWLAAQGRLPLAFIGLGLAWLAVATGMVVVTPGILALSHAAPAVVTLTHAWLLGFFLTVAMGASYQLAPVALGTTLWSERCAWWHFGLHAVSVPGMIYAFSRWDMALLGHFGTGLAMGVFLLALNTWKTVRRSGQRDVVARSLLLAAAWLNLTVVAGLILAANRFWHFIPLDPLTLLRAHAHLGLIGFFLTLLQGVTFRLVPMFTLGDVPDWKPARCGLWLSQLGLVGLAPALAWHAGYLAAAFTVCVLGGIVVSGLGLRQTLATRKKRKLDAGMRTVLRGIITLALGAGAGLLLVWPRSPWGSAPGGFSAMVYAVLVIAGGLLPIFAGMLCKIVPFLTWMRAYGPKVGRVPTPAASALTQPQIEAWSLRLQGLALVPLAGGVWATNLPLLQAGAGLLAAGVGLFLLNLLGVMKHLGWPKTGAAR